MSRHLQAEGFDGSVRQSGVGVETGSPGPHRTHDTPGLHRYVGRGHAGHATRGGPAFRREAQPLHGRVLEHRDPAPPRGRHIPDGGGDRIRVAGRGLPADRRHVPQVEPGVQRACLRPVDGRRVRAQLPLPGEIVGQPVGERSGPREDEIARVHKAARHVVLAERVPEIAEHVEAPERERGVARHRVVAADDRARPAGAPAADLPPVEEGDRGVRQLRQVEGDGGADDAPARDREVVAALHPFDSHRRSPRKPPPALRTGSVSGTSRPAAPPARRPTTRAGPAAAAGGGSRPAYPRRTGAH